MVSSEKISVITYLKYHRSIIIKALKLGKKSNNKIKVNKVILKDIKKFNN